MCISEEFVWEKENIATTKANNYRRNASTGETAGLIIFNKLVLTDHPTVQTECSKSIFKTADKVMNIADDNICPLCNRPLAGICNRHHLLPKSKGGKNTPTILLHKICHDKIHAVFTEMELKRHYNTIEKLHQNEEMQKFINWLSNKEPEFYDRSVKGKGRKKR